jgi:hypothetical protein
MTSTRTYTYSPFFRAIEVASIIAFVVFSGLLAIDSVKGPPRPLPRRRVVAPPDGGPPRLPRRRHGPSGTVPLAGRQLRGPRTCRSLGAALIRPFREHHVRFRARSRATTSSRPTAPNCLVWRAVAGVVLDVDRAGPEPVDAVVHHHLVDLQLGDLHDEPVPQVGPTSSRPAGWITWLQDHKLILSPAHHDIHHTPPFDRYLLHHDRLAELAPLRPAALLPAPRGAGPLGLPAPKPVAPREEPARRELTADSSALSRRRARRGSRRSGRSRAARSRGGWSCGTNSGALCHEPPRTRRYLPVVGPVGSTAGSAPYGPKRSATHSQALPGEVEAARTGRAAGRDARRPGAVRRSVVPR